MPGSLSDGMTPAQAAAFFQREQNVLDQFDEAKAILRGEGWMLAKDKTDYMGKSKGNTPGNNQVQNKQIDALERKYGLSKNERERLHRRISGEGLGYREIEDIIKNKDF